MKKKFLLIIMLTGLILQSNTGLLTSTSAKELADTAKNKSFVEVLSDDSSQNLLIKTNSLFTAKAGDTKLIIEKKVGEGKYNRDIYEVQIPLSAKDNTVTITGIEGYNYIKNNTVGLLENIPATWTLSVNDGDWYSISNFDKGEKYEIHFVKEKEPEPLPDKEILMSDVPFKVDDKKNFVSVVRVEKEGVQNPAETIYRVYLREDARRKTLTIKGLDGAKYVKDKTTDISENISRNWKITAEENVFYSIQTKNNEKFKIEFAFLANVNPPKAMPYASPTIPDDFENDIWLQYDFRQMKIGEKVDIYPRRVPQLIDSAISNGVTRPVFNFKIVEGDSVTLSEEHNREKIEVTAVKNGTTIVAVTYNAEDTAGASSPVNTAYVVYDVNNNPADIEIKTNISKIRSYDTLYFLEDELYFPLTITVSAPGAKNLEVSLNGNILDEKDGKYIANLENKSNIIGIKATDEIGKTKSYYQVVDARAMQIILENVNNKDNPIKNRGEPFKVNDKVRVSFRGITSPVYKLASIYNPTMGGYDDLNQKDTWPTSVVYINKELGDKDGELHGFANQWDLATKNYFELTLKEEKTYYFTGGHIDANWWGSPLGADKAVYGKGDSNFSAPILNGDFSSLPDFSISVGKIEKDKKVIDIENRINSIGDVDISKASQIKGIRDDFNRLSKSNKKLVESYKKLVDSEKKLNEIQGSGKANSVIDKINSIGDVSLSRERSIRNARKAFDSLSTELQARVTNIYNLEQAEIELTKLKEEKKKSDEKIADANAKIRKVGRNVSLEDESKIIEARTAYDKLSQDEKSKVSKWRFRRFERAEQKLKNLQAAKLLDDKISAIGIVTLNSKIAIKNARATYDNMSADQKNLVKNLKLLVEAEKRLEELEK